MKNLKKIKNRFVLGTVQLGMKYGLFNNHGQPNKEESFDILDTALAFGVNTFDTAWLTVHRRILSGSGFRVVHLREN